MTMLQPKCRCCSLCQFDGEDDECLLMSPYLSISYFPNEFIHISNKNLFDHFTEKLRGVRHHQLSQSAKIVLWVCEWENMHKFTVSPCPAGINLRCFLAQRDFVAHVHFCLPGPRTPL